MAIFCIVARLMSALILAGLCALCLPAVVAAWQVAILPDVQFVLLGMIALLTVAPLLMLGMACQASCQTWRAR